MLQLLPALASELEMLTADIPALQAEVDAASERLRRAKDKIAGIRELLAIYEAEGAPSMPKDAAPPPSAPTPPATAALGAPPAAPLSEQPDSAKRVSKKAVMEEVISSLLKERGTLHRSKILDHLIFRGIMGAEKDPLSHLAAFLSDHRGKFASDGRGNFELRRPGSLTLDDAMEATKPRTPSQQDETADPTLDRESAASASASVVTDPEVPPQSGPVEPRREVEHEYMIG